jgi:UDP:flavonoid glycosyltransferase YjiC (YdhE family)
MGNRDPQATTQLILDALDRTGQRGILTSGWGGMGELELPKNVYMLKSVPHSWLFPQMAAVIHHGGAGTTAAGLRAGIPSVIVPFFGDQPFWGHRVAQLGVGTDPLPKKQLTVESLAKRITETVTDQRMRDRAAELGRKIQAEQGVANAVALIQKSIHNRKSAVK